MRVIFKCSVNFVCAPNKLEIALFSSSVPHLSPRCGTVTVEHHKSWMGLPRARTPEAVWDHPDREQNNRQKHPKQQAGELLEEAARVVQCLHIFHIFITEHKEMRGGARLLHSAVCLCLLSLSVSSSFTAL